MVSNAMTQLKPNFDIGLTKVTPSVEKSPPAYTMPSSVVVAEAEKVATNPSLSGIVIGSGIKPSATPAALSSGFNFGQPTKSVPTFGLVVPKSHEKVVSKDDIPPAFGFDSKSAATSPFSFGGSSTIEAAKTNSGTVLN